MSEKAKTTAHQLDPAGVAEIPVSQLKSYMKFIGEHDLWDELEKHLESKGHKKILISYDHMNVISKLLEHKISTGAVKKKIHILPHCGCNGPVGPRPGPVTPPSAPPGGGGGDGGAPPPPPDGGGGGDGGGGIPIE